jgi:hypothetical protein
MEKILCLPVARFASFKAPSTASEPEFTKYTEFNAGGRRLHNFSASFTWGL